MHDVSLASAQFLLSIGAILLLGLATDFIGKRTFLPRITLLMLFGVLIGQHGLDLVPKTITNNFQIVTDMSLLVVGFLLGGQFELSKLKQARKEMLLISVLAALSTALFVTLFLSPVGLPLAVLFLMGCIASATAPAPIVDLILERKTQSPFSRLLLTIVAIDDVWALLLFSVAIALVGVHVGNGDGLSTLWLACYEIGGAALLGVTIGYPAAKFSGRICPGQPTLMEALGLVFVCGGLAIVLNVSFLLAVMVMGAMIVNLATHHEYAFHEIENIEWPFMVIFFVLAGASLHLTNIETLGLVFTLYVLGRIVGKLAGAWLGARLGGSSPNVRQWIGIALLPQAGVEIGMALIAANQFPQYSELFLSVVISATIFFEFIGPPLTKLALVKTEQNNP